MLGTIQIAGEDLNDVEIHDICGSLRNGSIRMLSLRGCQMDDNKFERISDSLKGNASLVQLNLSLGVLSNQQRVKWLSDALKQNKNLSSLLLHGNRLSDDDMKCLINALQSHPKISTLDVGDCDLTDEGLQQVCNLLPPQHGKTCLHTLTLTGNKYITQMGWSYLAIAIAASSRIRNLYLDYTKLGDYGAGVLAVAMAASSTIEKVDLEGCGVTDVGAEILFDFVANYPTSLNEINLADNDVSEDLRDHIKHCLMDDDTDDETSTD